MCPCGRLLHYNDPEVKRQVELLIAALGIDLRITVKGQGTYLVNRHLLGLHRFSGHDLEALSKVGWVKKIEGA
jgi:hypothetical protein